MIHGPDEEWVDKVIITRSMIIAFHIFFLFLNDDGAFCRLRLLLLPVIHSRIIIIVICANERPSHGHDSNLLSALSHCSLRLILP